MFSFIWKNVACHLEKWPLRELRAIFRFQSDWLRAYMIDRIKIKNQTPTVLQTAFRNGQTTRKSTIFVLYLQYACLFMLFKYAFLQIFFTALTATRTLLASIKQ